MKEPFPHRLIQPKIHPSVFVAPGVQIHGDVEIGKESNVWFNSVLRGDVHSIRIGERTNIQDLSLVHVSEGICPTIVGSNVTIGHCCILHGCTIGDFSLIGMGTTLLDRAEIGEYSLIGAGSLVTEGKKIPPYSKAFGRPARVIGKLSDAEIEMIKERADHYVTLAKAYKDFQKGN